MTLLLIAGTVGFCLLCLLLGLVLKRIALWNVRRKTPPRFRPEIAGQELGTDDWRDLIPADHVAPSYMPDL